MKWKELCGIVAVEFNGRYEEGMYLAEPQEHHMHATTPEDNMVGLPSMVETPNQPLMSVEASFVPEDCGLGVLPDPFIAEPILPETSNVRISGQVPAGENPGAVAQLLHPDLILPLPWDENPTLELDDILSSELFGDEPKDDFSAYLDFGNCST